LPQRRDLQKTQASDGGWPSLDGRESDAYSTRQALVALHEGGGVAITDANWQRGIEWLLKTQAADGSWHTKTQLYPAAPLGRRARERAAVRPRSVSVGAGRRVGRDRARGYRSGPGKKVVPEPLPGIAAERRAVGGDRPVRDGAGREKLLDSGFDRIPRRSPAADSVNVGGARC
jgi:hypothetical protein